MKLNFYRVTLNISLCKVLHKVLHKVCCIPFKKYETRWKANDYVPFPFLQSPSLKLPTLLHVTITKIHLKDYNNVTNIEMLLYEKVHSIESHQSQKYKIVKELS